MKVNRRQLGLVYWGTKGAGPEFCLKIVEELIKKDYRLILSISEDNEIFDRFRSLTNVDLVPVRTRRSLRFFLKDTIHRAQIARKLCRLFQDKSVDRIIGIMPGFFHTLFLPLYRPRTISYTSVIHDSIPHDGDFALLVKFLTYIEIHEADSVVVLSTNVYNDLLNLVPNHVSLRCAYHPIEVASDLGSRRLSSTPRIGMLGRIKPYKGVQIFCDASVLIRQYLERTASTLAPRYSVIGELDKTLDKLPNSYPFITWSSRWLSPNQFEKELALLDIVVLPYLEASQSGILAYAVSRGIPVVTSNVPGLANEVHELNAGLIFQSGSSDELAKTLLRLIEDPELYLRISHSELTTADKRSWRKLVDVILDDPA